MPSAHKLKDLYLAKSLQELQEKASISSDLTTRSASSLSTVAMKLYKEAQKCLHLDEEKAYILLYRCMNAAEQMRKAPGGKSDKTFDGKTQLTALTNLENLSKSLSERYKVKESSINGLQKIMTLDAEEAPLRSENKGKVIELLPTPQQTPQIQNGNHKSAPLAMLASVTEHAQRLPMDSGALSKPILITDFILAARQRLRERRNSRRFLLADQPRSTKVTTRDKPELSVAPSSGTGISAQSDCPDFIHPPKVLGVPFRAFLFRQFHQQVVKNVQESRYCQMRDQHELDTLDHYKHVWELLPDISREAIWKRLELFNLVAKYGWGTALQMLPASDGYEFGADPIPATVPFQRFVGLPRRRRRQLQQGQGFPYGVDPAGTLVQRPMREVETTDSDTIHGPCPNTPLSFTS